MIYVLDSTIPDKLHEIISHICSLKYPVFQVPEDPDLSLDPCTIISLDQDPLLESNFSLSKNLKN